MYTDIDYSGVLTAKNLKEPKCNAIGEQINQDLYILLNTIQQLKQFTWINTNLKNNTVVVPKKQ